MNNEKIDYALICNDKQENVLNKNCHHWSVCNKDVKFCINFLSGPIIRVRSRYIIYRVSVL